MKLEITQREKEGITVLDMKGQLVVGEAAGAFREKLTSLAAAGIKNVLLNMAGVDFVDSTGLGTMVICFTTFQKAGGKSKLVNLTRRNIELLVLTKLATVFEIFNDEQEAINSFFPDRSIQKFDILNFVQQQKNE